MSRKGKSPTASSSAPPAFPGVKLHAVDHKQEPVFGGLRFHSVTTEVVPGALTWVDLENVKRSERKLRMLPNPVSYVLEEQGKRPTMEDVHDCVDNCLLQFAELPDGRSVGYWAVYDGHGGVEAAVLVKERLLPTIMEYLCKAPNDVEGCLRRAFIDVDAYVLNRLGEAGNATGCTAAVALLIHRTLYVANVGDAEIFLGHNDGSRQWCSAVPLTRVHKASSADEKERIVKLGGNIFAGRLFGTLAISRAFGDGEMKMTAPYVSCEPHITKRELTPQDLFLVIACDGLWDRVSHDEAALFVGKLLRLRSLEDAVSFLMEEALDRNTKDNVTIICVNFSWSVPIVEDENHNKVLDRTLSVAHFDELTPGFKEFLCDAQLLKVSVPESFLSVQHRVVSPMRARLLSRVTSPRQQQHKSVEEPPRVENRGGFADDDDDGSDVSTSDVEILTSGQIDELTTAQFLTRQVSFLKERLQEVEGDSDEAHMDEAPPPPIVMGDDFPRTPAKSILHNHHQDELQMTPISGAILAMKPELPETPVSTPVTSTAIAGSSPAKVDLTISFAVDSDDGDVTEDSSYSETTLHILSPGSEMLFRFAQNQ